MLLSKGDVVRLAVEAGVGEYAADLVETVRSGWRLTPVAGEHVGRDRIGGVPDFAAGEIWPVNVRGIPLTFLAQVDCSRLPDLNDWQPTVAWNHGGRLVRIFGDLVDSPYEPGLGAVLSCPATEAATPTAQPPIPDPYPGGGSGRGLEFESRILDLPEVPVRVEAFLTAPETHPTLHPELFMYSEEAKRYEAWTESLRLDGREPGDGSPSGWELHHLLGHPTQSQHDPRGLGGIVYGAGGFSTQVGVEPDPALDPTEAWGVLLNLSAGSRSGLPDALGVETVTVVVPVSDLATGRYDRVICGTAYT